MSTTIPQTIDPNGIKVIADDQTKQMTMTMTDSTNKGLILDYDLTGTAKQFTLTDAGVKWTNGTNTYTTALDRLALVQQAFQAVELPPNATTLQLNDTLLLNDGTNTGSITLNGINTEITASGDLLLNPTGSIDANGKTLNMTGGEIHNCQLIHGQNNVDLVIEGKGNGDVILKTNGVNRITLADNGIATFSTLPECSTVPTTGNQLVNKTYVDSLPSGSSDLATVLTTGNSAGSNSINMNNNNITNVNNMTMENSATQKSIVLNEANNSSFYYPFNTVTSGSLQTAIKKSSTNKVTIVSNNEIAFSEAYEATNSPITNLTVSTSNIVPSYTPSINYTTGSISSVFESNSKLIYTDASTSKIFYLQDFVGSTFTQIDLSSLTTGSANYSARLSLIGIQQFIPIYYTSATNCKFFIRLGENSATSNFYLIKCEGDPTLLTSYTYATFYFTTANSAPANIIANGSPITLASTTNAMAINGQRINVINYDSVNDYLILGTTTSALTNNYYSVVTSDLTQYAVYAVNIPTGYTNTATSYYSSTFSQNSWFKIYNNNIATASGILQLVNWNTTTKTLSIAPDYNIGTGTTGDFPNSVNADGYCYDTPSTLYLTLPYADNLTAPNANLYVAFITWNKNIATTPILSKNVLLESTTAGQTYYTNDYVSTRMYDQNYIEIVSTVSDKMYVTSNAFTSTTTYSSVGVRSSFTVFTNGEGDGINQSRYSVVYAPHYFLRGTTTNVYTNSCLTSVTGNTASSDPFEYLNMGYNIGSSTGYINSTRDMTLTANPLRIASSLYLPVLPSTTTSAYEHVIVKNGEVTKRPNYFAYSYSGATTNYGANTAHTVGFIAGNTTVSGITFSDATDVFTTNAIGRFLVNYRITATRSATAGPVYIFLMNASNTAYNGSAFACQVGSTAGQRWTVSGTFVVNATSAAQTIKLGVSCSEAFVLENDGASSPTPPTATSSAQISIIQIE